MAAVPRLCLQVAVPLVGGLVVLTLRIVVPYGLFALCGQSRASAWHTSREVGMKFQQVTQLLVLSLQTLCPPSEAAVLLGSPQGGDPHRRRAGPCCPAAQLNPRPVLLLFPHRDQGGACCGKWVGQVSLLQEQTWTWLDV